MTATTTDVLAAPRRSGRRRVIVVVLLLLAGAAASWWVTHPRMFGDGGATVTGSTPAGTAAYVGMEAIPRDGVELHGAHPRVVLETGDIAVTVLVCRPVGSTGVGFVHADGIASLCEPLSAPEGPVQRGDFLVAEVVGDSSGVVVLDGIDVTYSSGVQRGTETVGVDAAVVIEDR